MAKAGERIALVTGANKGLGYEIGRQLARNGLHVILTSRDADKGLRAQKKLERAGLHVNYCELDVTRRGSVSALARYIGKVHGRVDVLVNNAGIMIDHFSTSVLVEKEDVFRRTLETNFFGALRLCQAVVPLMRQHGYGRIVNLSSGLGQLDDMGDGNAAYRVSKTALNALTRMVATATARDGISS